VSSAEQRARKKAFLSNQNRYKAMLVSWGVKLKTPAQKKAVNGLINRLSKAYYNTGVTLSADQFQKQVVAKAPKAWLQSTVGAQRLAAVKTMLQELFGADYATALKDKDLLKIGKQYAFALKPDEEKYAKQLLSTARGKAEFANLAAFNEGVDAGGFKTLNEQLGAYKAYEKALNDTLARAGLDPAADAAVFFKSGVTSKDLSDNMDSYLANREAFAQVLGRQMTNEERQAALYGRTGEQRSALARAGEARQYLTDANLSSFANVLGSALSAEERAGLLYGRAEDATRTVGALQRAGSVEDVIKQQGESYRLQTGQQLTQAQREAMLRDQNAGGVYDALKSAFSLQQSYRKGSAGTFGFSRNQSGQITQNI
jgi:hypothetical protein